MQIEFCYHPTLNIGVDYTYLCNQIHRPMCIKSLKQSYPTILPRLRVLGRSKYNFLVSVYSYFCVSMCLFFSYF